MIRANFSREQILSCGYTDDELEEVEKRLFVNN